MKNKGIWRAVKFVLFSCTAGIIEALTFALLNELVHLPYWPAYLIGLFCSVVYNFTVNRRYTFRSANNVPVAMLKALGYYCVFTPLSTWGGDWLTASAGWNEYLVLAITMVLNLLTEFLFCRYVVFRDSLDTNALAKKDEKA